MHRTIIKPTPSPLGVMRVDVIAGHTVATPLVMRETLDHERVCAHDHATIARGRVSWRDRAAEDAYMALFY